MAQLRFLLAILAVAALAFLASATLAQSKGNSSSAPYPSKPLPSDLSGSSYQKKSLPATETIAPSAFNLSSSADAHPIEFLSQDEMTDADRAIAATAQPPIRKDATLAGFDLDTGTWTYQQLVCAALPSHVFLVFRGDNGKGDVSLFSASIPRDNGGHVRIIAIQRRGFSLFSPTPVNPLTISAFNRIRANDPPGKSADWLSTALCYAALTGSHPQTTSSPGKSGGVGLSLTLPPTLEIGSHGESNVRFVDVSPARQPMQWALSFDPKGQLVKVTQFASPPFQVKTVPPLANEDSNPQASR